MHTTVQIVVTYYLIRYLKTVIRSNYSSPCEHQKLKLSHTRPKFEDHSRQNTASRKTKIYLDLRHHLQLVHSTTAARPKSKFKAAATGVTSTKARFQVHTVASMRMASLLGCSVVQSGGSLPTFQSCLLPQSPDRRDNGGRKCLWNVKNLLPDCTTLRPKREAIIMTF
jgi:hypothetical protein